MSGIEMPLEESGWMIVVIVALVVIFTLTFTWLGFLRDYNPTDLPTGPLFYSTKDIESIQSVEALVCAINSVAEKQEYNSPECLKYWNGASSSGGSGSAGPLPGIPGISATIIGESPPDGGRGKYLCHRISVFYYCSEFCQPNDKIEKLYNTAEECEEAKMDITTQAVLEQKKSAGIDCSGTPGSDGFSCKVSNFNVPQDVSELDEWIPYHGDPQYLVYWQNLPAEEDTWNFQTSWKMYAAIGFISIVPWGKVLKPVAGRVLGEGLEYLSKLGVRRYTTWTAKKFFDAITRVRFWKTLSKNGLGKSGAVKRFMRKSLKKVAQRQGAGGLKAGKAVVKNSDDYLRMMGFIDSLSSEQIDNAFTATTKEMADAAVDFRHMDNYLREFSDKLTDNIFKEGGEQGVPSLAGLEKSVKKEMANIINDRIMHLASREVMKETWIKRLVKKYDYSDIPNTAVKATTLTGLTRVAEMADSIIDAREEEIPNTIVIKKPFFEPIEYELSDVMNGRPVFVNLKNVKSWDGLGILPDWMDEKKHFYFASPCHLKELTVSDLNVKCGNYVHEKKYEFNSNTGEATSSNIVKECGGEIEILSRIGQPSCEINEYEIETTGLDADDRDFVDWISNLNQIPDHMGVFYNETDNYYVIPIAKESYIYYEPDSSNEKFIYKGDSSSVSDIAMKEKELEAASFRLPEDVIAAKDIIVKDLLECFDRLDSGSTETCVIYDTRDLGGEITEEDIEDHMKQKLLDDELERAKDLIGEKGWDNMDWGLKYISSGSPLFVKMYPDYSGVNEIHVDEIDNKFSLDFSWNNNDGRTLTREIEIKKYDAGIVNLKVKFSSFQVELSDLGDDGILRSISVRKGDELGKSMTDLDIAEDGFEKIELKNCHVKGVLIDRMSKTSDEEHDPNYCTRGETTSGMVIESLGDYAIPIALVGACIIGALPSAGTSCLGAVSWLAGTGAFWVAAGLAEVGTEAYEKVGGWPTQTW
jgi:hypothetical protein